MINVKFELESRSQRLNPKEYDDSDFPFSVVDSHGDIYVAFKADGGCYVGVRLNDLSEKIKAEVYDSLEEFNDCFSRIDDNEVVELNILAKTI